MLYLPSSLAIAATLAINAFALPVETVQGDQSPTPESILSKRGMPSCPVQYGEAFEPKEIPSDVQQDAAESLSSRQTYKKAGWKHPICGYYQVNCYTIDKGIDYTGSTGDIGTELGRWYGEDGTQILAFHYWHNELGFKGPGGSAKIYPAHGYFFNCAHGKLDVTITFNKVGDKGPGGSHTLHGNDQPDVLDPDGWPGPCRCYGNTRWDIFGSDMSITWGN
ncbi:hypothetical protein EJ03DRAFT_146693 [Teratosphaeria nubilosa]|uniref:Uncharacterized protein n=1 Tax=Teratosphaeria nubilosa TaxID=161662 RepID=A0A6G1L3T4_9PEZI|nr:hypothetical protein EJ03DRAFT_146693 [Teratosphaeria nubilosa]